MSVEPKPMHDLPAHHLVPDALTPEQIESKAETVAISKANMPFVKLFVLAMFAGAFVALGAAFFTVVMGDTEMGFAAQRALGSLGSVAGLSGSHAVAAAVLTAASAGWCPLGLDFAMTVAPALIAEARRALPRAHSAVPAFSAGPVPAMAGAGTGAMTSTVPAMADAAAMAGTDAGTDAGSVSPASYDVGDATVCPTEALGMIDVTPPVAHNATVDETGMKTGITTERDADGEVLDAADDHE